MTDSIVTKALKRLRRIGGKIFLSLLICALLAFDGPIVFAQGKDKTVLEFSVAPSLISFYSRDKLINGPLPFSEYSLWIKEWPIQFEFRILPIKGLIFEGEGKFKFLWESYAGTLTEEKSFDKGGGYYFRLTTGWKKSVECPVGLSFVFPVMGYSQQMSRWAMEDADYNVRQKTLDIGGEIRFTDNRSGVFLRSGYGGRWERADIDGIPVSVLYEYKSFLNMLHVKFGGEIKLKKIWLFLEIDGNETIFSFGKNARRSGNMDGSSAEILLGIRLKVQRGKG